MMQKAMKRTSVFVALLFAALCVLTGIALLFGTRVVANAEGGLKTDTITPNGEDIGDNSPLISKWYGDNQHGGKFTYVVDDGMETPTTAEYVITNKSDNIDQGLVMSICSANYVLNQQGEYDFNFSPTAVYGFAPGWAGKEGDSEELKSKGVSVGTTTVQSTNIEALRAAYKQVGDNTTEPPALYQKGVVTLKDGILTYVVGTYYDSDHDTEIGHTTYVVTLEDRSVTSFPVKFAFDPCGSTAIKTASVTYVEAAQADPYTLTFSAGEDATVTPASKEVRGGAKVGVLPTPVKVHFEFKGWYDNDQYTGDEITADTVWNKTEGATLHAKWEAAPKRTVTFKVEGQNDKQVTVEHGEKVPGNEVPTVADKENHYFNGWQTEEGVKFDVENDVVTGDIVLVPIWVENPLIPAEGFTIAANTGDGDDMSLISRWHDNDNHGGAKIYLVEGKTTVVVMKIGACSNESERFDRGLILSLLNQNGTDVYKDNVSTSALYGWKNGGWDGGAGGFKEVYAVTRTDDGKVSEVYGATDALIQVGRATLNSGVLTYVIETYAGNDEHYKNLLCSATYTINLNDADLEEYPVTFAFDKTNANATLTSATIKYVTENNVLTATFDKNDGGSDAPETKTVMRGGNKTINAPAAPARTGYDFKGWQVGEDTATLVQADAEIELSASVNYLAVWEAKEYTITLNANGGTFGTEETSEVTATYGVVPTFATPTYEGYDFAGWYTQAEGGDKIDVTVAWTREDVTTLYAHWTEEGAEPPVVEEKVTVTFDLNGGTGTAPAQTIDKGGKVEKPANPTREGYTFAGWYTAASGGTEWNFETGTVTSNITLYAIWTENTPSTPGTPGTGDDTPGTTPGTTTEPAKKKGCGSAVMAETSAIIAALMLALAGMVVLKKKAENK